MMGIIEEVKICICTNSKLVDLRLSTRSRIFTLACRVANTSTVQVASIFCKKFSCKNNTSNLTKHFYSCTNTRCLTANIGNLHDDTTMLASHRIALKIKLLRVVIFKLTKWAQGNRTDFVSKGFNTRLLEYRKKTYLGCR